MGAITVDGTRPYAFVKAHDGQADDTDSELWANWWSGTAWAWTNQGRPKGVTLQASMGAITVDKGRPYVFVKCSDEALWVNWWSGTAWAWAHQGRPKGVTLQASMGAVTVDGSRPHVFVKGSDGNLWLNSWSGTAWAWTNQSRPAGVTLEVPMGATTVDKKRPYVFVKGSDGNLWLNWWSGTAWAWTNHGRPAGKILSTSMGATTVDGGRPYVFVKCIDDKGDDELWLNWWSGTAWAWTNQNMPKNLDLIQSNGAVTVDGGRPYVFVKANTGKGALDNLWLNSWSGTDWAWSLQA